MKFKILSDFDEYEFRKNHIFSLTNDRNITPEMGDLINIVVLSYTLETLEKYAQKFDVKPGKLDKRKYKKGLCYSNSIKIMKEMEFNYVEGYVKTNNGNIIAHAWNCDMEGNHFDFTLKPEENHSYFGIIIPQECINQIGEKNGYIWFANLPFLEIN